MFFGHGLVAQLGERCVRNAEAEGSIPFKSTTSCVSSTPISRLTSCGAQIVSRDPCSFKQAVFQERERTVSRFGKTEPLFYMFNTSDATVGVPRPLVFFQLSCYNISYKKILENQE